MCHKVTCNKCGKPTWEGCGEHIEYALADVPQADRCTCDRSAAPAPRASAGGVTGSSW